MSLTIYLINSYYLPDISDENVLCSSFDCTFVTPFNKQYQNNTANLK